MKDWTDEERKLFEESRRLKEKARGLVAKRHAAMARQKYWQEEAKKRAEQLAAKIEEAERAKKFERDARIRKALLDMASIAKANNLAFRTAEAGMVKLAFDLIDRDYDSPTYGKVIKINCVPTGFQWD